MIDRKILPALTVTGLLLLLAYGAAWLWLLQPSGQAERAHDEATAAEERAQADARSGSRLYYRVTDPQGQTHIIDVSRLDSAMALMIATREHGEGSTIEQIDAETALQARGPALVPEASPAWFAGLLLLLPASLLVAALRLRGRVRALDVAWEQLQHGLTGTGEALMDAAGIDERGLQRTLEGLNAGRGLELRWNRATDRIADARLTQFTLTVRHCPRCNESVHARMSADPADVPSCQRCLAPLEGPELAQQRRAVVERLTTPHDGARRGASSPFSLAVFLLWSLLFPPLGAAYALHAAK